MASKSKFRSPPRTPSGAVPQPNSTPRNSVPGTDGIPRTPFSVRAITPVVGTLKSVSLSDWWLVKKTNDKVLCVAGFESKDERLYSSGPISKRHDSQTLETLDGIEVCISGFIDRSRTLENGFSREVCNRFLTGFPYNWNDYEEEEEEEEEEVKKRVSISFDDVPVNRINDLCMKSDILDLDDVFNSLRDLAGLSKEESDKESRVMGVKTRGMLRRRQDNETCSKKKKKNEG